MENKEKDMSFETYIVRAQKLYHFLKFKGFYCKRIEKSRDNPKWNVFHFTNNEELLKAIEEYRSLTKNK